MTTTEIRSKAEFSRFIEKGIALVDFYAPWCAPCRAQEPVVAALGKAYEQRAAIGRMDVERVRSTARSFGIQSIPTLILFCNGSETDRFIGLQRRETLVRSIDSALALSEDRRS